MAGSGLHVLTTTAILFFANGLSLADRIKFESVEALTEKAARVLKLLTEEDFQHCFEQWKIRRKSHRVKGRVDISADGCGMGSNVGRRQPRIINGRESVKGAWPWQASLQVLHPRLGMLGHWCGAVLIHPQWALSAAHCINNDFFNLPIPALWTLVLGEWDHDKGLELRVPVDKIMLHSQFNHFQNDIVLMMLSRPVDEVMPVCLRHGHLKTGGKFLSCMATGWGSVSRGGQGLSTSQLLEIKIPLHDLSVCQKQYKNIVHLGKGHLCAGRLDGSTGTCLGDSGGPLQCSTGDGSWFLAGITSFGSGCARPGFPDIYTKISYYLPWIKTKMNETSLT